MMQAWLTAALVCFAGTAAAQTQDEMTRTACAEKEAAEQELKRTYREILGKYHADRAFIKSFKNAQRAWLSYRDAHVRSLYPHENSAEYGTVYSMCRCSSLAEITVNRIRELEQWTQGVELGDVCTGSRATRD